MTSKKKLRKQLKFWKATAQHNAQALDEVRGRFMRGERPTAIESIIYHVKPRDTPIADMLNSMVASEDGKLSWGWSSVRPAGDSVTDDSLA